MYTPDLHFARRKRERAEGGMEISLRSGEFIRPLGSCDTDRPRVSCYSFSREVALRAVKRRGRTKSTLLPLLITGKKFFVGPAGYYAALLASFLRRRRGGYRGWKDYRAVLLFLLSRSRNKLDLSLLPVQPIRGCCCAHLGGIPSVPLHSE